MRAKTDNGHVLPKRTIRREALRRSDGPVLETHAGKGEMRAAVWHSRPGILCERDPEKCDFLARRFPDLTVYQGDSLKLLRAKDIGITPGIVDIDAYGDPWPHVDHCLRAAWLPDKVTFVVTDGLVRAAGLGTGWTKGSLRPVVEKIGNDLFKRYPEAVLAMIDHLRRDVWGEPDIWAFRWYPNICYYAFDLQRNGGVLDGLPLMPNRTARRADPFYSSPLWKSLRGKALRRDRNSCTRCGSQDALQVDHIRPRRLGGVDKLENLRTLCHSCHSRSTCDGVNNGVFTG